MNIYIAYRYNDAVAHLATIPEGQVGITADQANKIKSIMDRTAQEIKRVTGKNPIDLEANVNGIIFIKRYSNDQQILVDKFK